MMQFDTFQNQGKVAMDAAMKSFGAMSKGAQAAAVEAADFAKRSLEQGTATFEKLTSARALDSAVQIQGDYLRTSYEGFVAQTTRLGEIAAATAKDAFAPVEELVRKPVTTA